MKKTNKPRRILRRNFKKIKISERFLQTPPKERKVQKKLNAYLKEGKLDPIIVDEHMTLVDGYCTYLLAFWFDKIRRKVKIYMKKGE